MRLTISGLAVSISIVLTGVDAVNSLTSPTSPTSPTGKSTVKSTFTPTSLAVTTKVKFDVTASTDPPTSINTDPVTSIVSAMGDVEVPALSATASIAQVTATIDYSGIALGAQVAMKPAAGDGPGLCVNGNGTSTFQDDWDNTYELICGYGPYGQYADITHQRIADWETCIKLCHTVDTCDTVVYARELRRCYFKNMASVAVPTLRQNDLRQVAYIPRSLKRPFVWPSTYTTPAPTSTGFLASLLARTTVIPATGTITLPAITTDPGTIVDATATVVFGSTIGVQVQIKWMMGGGKGGRGRR